MKSLQARLGVIGAMAAFSLAPLCNADTWDRKTKISTTAPIEVPGAVLQPGTYIFKLANSSSNRHIMQIMNEDENRLYAMTFTVPALRLVPTDKPVLTFYESRGDSPRAVRAIYYPGEVDGDEFIYKNGRANLHAASYTAPTTTTASVEQAPAEPAKESETVTLPAAKVPPPIETAQAEPQSLRDESVQLAQAQPPAQPTPAPETPAPAASETPTPSDELPKTASNLPLIALTGFSAIGLALGLRKWSHQS